MALYVPGTEETDPKKLIMSQQLVAGQTSTNTTNITTNTTNIATNTANIATNTADISALQAAGATYVVGPGSATDNALARFDSTTGKLVQNSEITLGDSDGKLTRTAGISLSGTNTNDSAASGYIGEYNESTLVVASAITLTNNTAANITSVSLAGGDYDVWGVVLYVPGGSTATTQILGWVSTTSATFPGNDSGQISGPGWGAGLTGGSASFISVIPTRILLSGTTTVYLSTRALFTSTAPTASGTIKWRRRR